MVEGRYRYHRMTGAQLRDALRALGISRHHFAKLLGAKPDKVLQWMEDRDQAPHYVALVCSLLTLPGGMDMAERVTGTLAYLERREDGDQ